MVVDTVEDVVEIGLRIEPVLLGRLDDRHGAGQRFAAGVGAREEPVLPTDVDRAQGSLGRVVVDGHAAIGEEEAERSPAGQPIAERAGEVALAGDPRELAFGPVEEGLDLRGAVRLPRGKADLGGPPVDFPLDVVERTDAVERLARDGGFRLVLLSRR